jgi:2-methylcitrate dehydratase PrpD
MANKEEKLIIDRLSENILNTRFEDIDQGTVDNTKRRILDMIGCAIGGARGDGNSELVALARDWGGKKEATVLAYGVKAPAHEVAMINCVFGRTFDRGPLTLIIDRQRFPNHTTETTVLTALAMGEGKGISGKELITATVVGDDLAARLHIATDRSQPGQVNSPGSAQPPMTRGTTDTFAAAAIAGRLMGLNAAHLRNAFGMSLIYMGGGGMVVQGSRPGTGAPAKSNAGTAPAPQKWQGFNDPVFQAQLAKGGYEENTSVKLVQGLAAKRGINAAQLAQAGWVGPKDAFFGERGGYYPGTASCNRIDRVTADLGKRYHVEQVFKPYPGGKPTHAPTDAAIALATKNNINIDDIEEVLLHLSPPATAMHYAKSYIVGDYPTMNALWSYYFSVASALMRRSSKNQNFTREYILDPRLQALIKKVKLADLDKPVGVEVEVKMKDGHRFSEYMSVASGEPAKPMTRDDLIAKFMEQVEFSQAVSQDNADKLVELLEKLEEVDNIKKIVQLAVKH